jgi:Caspase domain
MKFSLRTFLISIIGLCCLISFDLVAQINLYPPKLDRQVTISYKRDNYMQHAVASASGGVVAVGYTEGVGFSGDDILITKIDSNGTIVFQRTIGTYDKDRCSAFDEDMFGELYIIGSSERRIDKGKALTRLWFKKMTDKGVVSTDTVFSEIKGSASLNYVKFDGTSLNLLGIENDSLKSWIISTDGVIYEQYFYKVECLRRLNVKKCTVLATVEATYIYGFGTWLNASNKGQAFVIKINNTDGTVMENRAFPDKNVKDIGNIILTEQDDIILTGTTNKIDMTDENVFVIKIDKTTLSPTKNGFEKIYDDFKPNNFDEGSYIFQSGQDSLTVFGSSKSHKQASHTTNFMTFPLSLKTGDMLMKKPIFWGDEQEDRIQTVVRTNNGNFWICGSKDKGNSVVKDIDFYFAKIYTPKLSITTEPINLTADEEPFFVNTTPVKIDTLYAGNKMSLDFRVEVKIENRDFKGYRVKAFNRTNNSKVQLPESIDLSGKKWQNLDLKLPISLDADFDREDNVAISLCLFNPHGQCLDTLEKMIHIKPKPKPNYTVVSAVFKGEQGDSIFKAEKAIFTITLKNVGNAKGKQFSLNMSPANNVLFIEQNNYQELEWEIGQSKTFAYQFIPQDLIKESSLEFKISYKDAITPSVFSVFRTPLGRKKMIESPVFIAEKLELPKVPLSFIVAEKSEIPTIIFDKMVPRSGRLAINITEKLKIIKAQPIIIVATKLQKIDVKLPVIIQEKEQQPELQTPAIVTEKSQKQIEEPFNNNPQKKSAATINGIAVVVVWRQNFKAEKLTLDVEDYIVEVVATGVHALEDKNFTIIHNGIEKRIDGLKMDEISLDNKPTTPQSYSTYLDFKLKLTPGINTISVKVKDGEFGNTTPEIKINYRPFDKGTLYVLSVGVPDKSGRLHYTQKDAHDFAKIFSDKSGGREVQVLTLTSPDSTTATSIATNINELSKQAIRSNDAVILYLSTHGIIGEKNELRLLGSNYTVDNKKFTSIDFREDIIQPLQRLTCSKYLFIDACKSGSVKEQKDVTDSLQKILQDNSFFTLVSCSGSETSYEDDRWQNGAFTKVLKEIVTNPVVCKSIDGADGTSPDGFLSLIELSTYLIKKVQELVKKDRNEKQTPVLMTPFKNETKPIFNYKRS